MAELLSFAGSLGRHLQALLALAGHETKEAAGLYLRLVILLIAALIFFVLGYVFLLFFIASLLAVTFGINWIWISLGLALFHLIGTAVCGLYVRNHLPTPVFTSTSAELKRDFANLKQFES
ncbi:MAG: phage holin family protein [Terrimicrobiaceae bacterium]